MDKDKGISENANSKAEILTQINWKFEARNTKQILNPNFQMLKIMEFI